MDKGDMRLLDLSRNKLTILPNLLVWRSEVPSTAARPGGVERQGAQAFKEEQFLEKNEDEMYEEIIDDLYEKLYMISKQIKVKLRYVQTPRCITWSPTNLMITIIKIIKIVKIM